MRTDFRNAVGTEKEKFGYCHESSTYLFSPTGFFLKVLRDSKKKKTKWEIYDLPQGTLGDPKISARLVILHRPEGGCQDPLIDPLDPPSRACTGALSHSLTPTLSRLYVGV